MRLNYAIDSVGATRVVLDTIESLFSGLPNPMILRAELRRLFHWLKNKGVTAIITGERGEGTLTRQGLEEYVSDCVILLDHRVTDETSTRRLRIVKYRGSLHGTNEYPFLIDEKGISVLPITSLGLNYQVNSDRISSGIPELDEMLGGKGFYKGSSILVSGTAGTGKSSLSAHFAEAACKRGEKVLYFALEESPAQIARNMESIGIKLEPFVKKNLLQFCAMRPTLYGLEMHLVKMIKLISGFNPDIVIVDPLNSFLSGNNESETKSMCIRLIDFLKSHKITAFFTSLSSGGNKLENTNIFISSLIDTWVFVRGIEIGGERNRGIYILKSRGMSHSNQIREFLITDNGVKLRDVYVGLEGVLTGSARIAVETKERNELLRLEQEKEMKQLRIEQKQKAMEAQIAYIRAEFEAEKADVLKEIQQDRDREKNTSGSLKEISELRGKNSK